MGVELVLVLFIENKQGDIFSFSGMKFWATNKKIKAVKEEDHRSLLAILSNWTNCDDAIEFEDHNTLLPLLKRENVSYVCEQ